MKCIAQIHITPDQVMLNGQAVSIVTEDAEAHTLSGKAMLTVLYKQQVGDYPKFYKMDPLARLGFIASELLLQSLGEERFVEREDRAVVLVNRSASLAADRKYEETIQTGDNYFPSPADFVYTLPNIVTGEIAIRNHYHGETTFLVIDQQEDEPLNSLIAQAFEDEMTQSVLGGWLECQDENHFDAQIGIYQK